MEVLVSFVVPVFNVEKYLEKCVNSIRQINKYNIEIILVDDESKDNSGKLCDLLAAEDKRITVIHKENGGVSSARNKGMSVARGEWISFVDSDDELEADYEERILSNLDAHAQICIYNYNEMHSNKVLNRYSNKNLPVFFSSEDKSKIINGFFNNDDLEYQKYVVSPLYYISVWNKLYKTELLKQNEIIFPENTPWGEDYIFNIRAIIKASHIKNIFHNGYKYRIQSLSISNRYCGEAMEYYRNMITDLQEIIDQELSIEQAKLDEYILRQFLYTAQRSVFNVDNPDSWKIRKKEFLSYRKLDIVKKSFKSVNFSNYRMEVRVGILLLKYNAFWGLVLLFKLKKIVKGK